MYGNTINSDLIRGNIDTIILSVLNDGDRYGYDILSEISKKSDGKYEIKQPTLYSCLKRLENQGFIYKYWGTESNGGRRSYYSLTDMGKELFAQNKQDWTYSKNIIDKLIDVSKADAQETKTVETTTETEIITSTVNDMVSNTVDDSIDNTTTESTISLPPIINSSSMSVNAEKVATSEASVDGVSGRDIIKGNSIIKDNNTVVTEEASYIVREVSNSLSDIVAKSNLGIDRVDNENTNNTNVDYVNRHIIDDVENNDDDDVPENDDIVRPDLIDDDTCDEDDFNEDDDEEIDAVDIEHFDGDEIDVDIDDDYEIKQAVAVIVAEPYNEQSPRHAEKRVARDNYYNDSDDVNGDYVDYTSDDDDDLFCDVSNFGLSPDISDLSIGYANDEYNELDDYDVDNVGGEIDDINDEEIDEAEEGHFDGDEIEVDEDDYLDDDYHGDIVEEDDIIVEGDFESSESKFIPYDRNFLPDKVSRELKEMERRYVRYDPNNAFDLAKTTAKEALFGDKTKPTDYSFLTSNKISQSKDVDNANAKESSDVDNSEVEGQQGDNVAEKNVCGDESIEIESVFRSEPRVELLGGYAKKSASDDAQMSEAEKQLYKTDSPVLPNILNVKSNISPTKNNSETIEIESVFRAEPKSAFLGGKDKVSTTSSFDNQISDSVAKNEALVVEPIGKENAINVGDEGNDNGVNNTAAIDVGADKNVSNNIGLNSNINSDKRPDDSAYFDDTDYGYFEDEHDNDKSSDKNCADGDFNNVDGANVGRNGQSKYENLSATNMDFTPYETTVRPDSAYETNENCGKSDSNSQKIDVTPMSHEEYLALNKYDYQYDNAYDGKYDQLIASVRGMGDNLKIRTYESSNIKEYNKNYHYYSNKLRLYKNGFLFFLMILEIIIPYFVIKFGYGIQHPAELPVLILGTIVAAFFPTYATARYLLDPFKHKRYDFELWSSLLCRIGVMLLMFVLIYAVNVVFYMDISLEREYAFSLIMPALLSTNIPLSPIIFVFLYKTRMFAVQ